MRAGNGRTGRRRARGGGLAWGFAAGASLLSLLLYWYHPPLLERLDIRGRDLVFQMREAPPPPPGVAVVAVDEKSIKHYGRWPWPRTLQAELIARLKGLGAGVIALDIVYPRPQDPEQDQALARALSLPGAPVIGGYFFRAEKSLPENASAVAPLTRNRIGKILERPGARADAVPEFPFVESNQAELAGEFSGTGFFNYIPDPDGLVRAAPLVLRYRGSYYPGLPLLALSRKLGEDITLTLTPEGVGGIGLGPLRIPVDGNGRLALNFYNGAEPIPIVSAADVLDGRLPAQAVQDRLVFVGITELGIADVRATPVEPSFPGVAVHATVAANVLQGFHLARDGRAVLLDVALTAFVPLAMVGFMSSVRRPAFMAGAFLATLVLVWSVFCWAVTRYGLLISFVYPSAAAAMGYLAFHTYYVRVTQAHTRFLQQAFSTYVSPALVERLIRHPEALTLTGEKRTVSILFSDIRGFTALAEALPAEQLVPILNRYLGPMTAIVMDENGTLDKYIGDALMAIYNAPLDVADHAERAVRSALRMLETLESLNQGLERDHGIRLQIGIGIHTGEVVVGNMGSDQRFDYTAIGDTVNLASRLEGRTKAYGVDIVVSDSTRTALQSGFALRKLDRLRVNGKTRPSDIYEVLCNGEDPKVRTLTSRFEQALALYFSNQFAQALQQFLEIQKDYPLDKPTRIFAERCRTYLQTPPAADWGGVFIATDK